MPTPAELREQFLELRNSGAPLPRPVAGLPAPRSRPTAPKRAPIQIDRDAPPKEQAAQISRALGALLPGWTYRDRSEDGDYYRHTFTHDETGAEFLLAIDGNRLDFSGSFPRSELDSYYFSASRDTEYKRVTVALRRAPEDIAADVLRRFAPAFLREYAKRLKDRDDYDAGLMEQKRVTCELAAIVGAEPRHGCGISDRKRAEHFYGDAGGASIRCKVSSYASDHRERVELTLNTSETTARAVLDLLAKARRG